jgi:uncharacterized protein DUF1217
MAPAETAAGALAGASSLTWAGAGCGGLTMDPLITTLGIPSGMAGWNILQTKTPASFPALTSDPVVKSAISYFEQNAPKATTAQTLLSDPRLQDFVLTAFGLTSESGMTALLQKVLQSNPTDQNSFAAQMNDARYSSMAQAFNYGGKSTPAVPATPSSAEVSIDGLFSGSNFATFSGTFGGVTVSNVGLAGVTTWQGLANTLQAAFQRADGNRSDIKVTLDGLNLKFTDAKGRGTATSFDWTTNAGNTGPDPTASAPQDLVTGALAQPEQGGPNVTSPSFIQQVVQKYTQAQFEQVIGNTSNTLREAEYAQHELPTITNWYSVIANQPLANVIQTVLGLPQSFAMTNVDQQVRILSSRMNIKDFQDPTKLSKLLNQFVALSTAQSQDPSQNAAVQLLNSAGSNGIINLTLPGQSTVSDSYSSASTAAMLLSTAIAGG